VTAKPKIGVSYHRVSTTEQDPTLAREELRRAAQARDIFLIDEVEETGSGARNDRPGLQRVMQLVRAHLVSNVLVWKLDRFGRSTIDVVSNVKTIKNAGATGIILVGFDGLPDEVTAIKAGTETASVAQHPAKIGSLGVATLYAAIVGKKVSKNVDTGTSLITSANAK